MTSDAMKSIDEQPTTSGRRWLRYSLRSMLLLVVVIAIPMGWVGWKINRARNQRIVVAELRKLDAKIIYDFEVVYINGGGPYSDVPTPGPKWLIDFLGKEYFVEVQTLLVGGPQVTDETLALIATLDEVTDLHFRPVTGITDSGLAHLAGLQNLKQLTLSSDQIQGTGLVHLTGLPRLQKLWAFGWVTDASLEHVATLKHLESLSIDGPAQITDGGLAHIATLRDLRTLDLGGSRQDGVRVSDEGLSTLCSLKNLEYLRLSTTALTRAGIDKLQTALPNCRMWINTDIETDPDEAGSLPSRVIYVTPD